MGKPRERVVFVAPTTAEVRMGAVDAGHTVIGWSAPDDDDIVAVLVTGFVPTGAMDMEGHVHCVATARESFQE